MANSATLTTMLSLTSANATSDVLNFKINKLLVVLNDVVKKRVLLKSNVSTSILPALEYTKSYVFVNNISTFNISLVKTTNGDEYMHLAPGQFAWFPWSATLNLEAIAQGVTAQALDAREPQYSATLEVMVFELGHTQ